eukprot:scaffold353987_cov52-Prasinocladus_malaysianus.AAC.1
MLQDFKEIARLYPEEAENIIKRVRIAATNTGLLMGREHTILLAGHKEASEGIDEEDQGQDDGDNHLKAVQRSMEAAEKKKHKQKVVQMVGMAAVGDLMALKVRRRSIDESQPVSDPEPLKTYIHTHPQSQSIVRQHQHCIHTKLSFMNVLMHT